MGACSMCSGTDCAAACAQGQCYAEEMQRQAEAQAELEAMEAEYQAQLEMADTIGAFAIAFSDNPARIPEDRGIDDRPF